MSEACSVNGMMPHLENKWRTDSSFTKVALQDRGNILKKKRFPSALGLPNVKQAVSWKLCYLGISNSYIYRKH